MNSTRSSSRRGPLDRVDHAFQTLLARPHPPIVAATAIGHPAADRGIPVARLRQLLPGLSAEGRDVVWRDLVHQARCGSQAWTLVCCGLALPGLRTAAAQASIGYHGDPDDLDAEVLTGFLEALGSGVLPERGVCGSLWRAAYNAGRRARRAQTRYAYRHHPSDVLSSAPPAVSVTHPDLLLVQAVAEGQVNRVQAELVALVCVEEVSLRQAAAMLGLSFGTAQRRLSAAKTALAAWLSPLTGNPARQGANPSKDSTVPSRGGVVVNLR